MENTSHMAEDAGHGGSLEESARAFASEVISREIRSQERACRRQRPTAAAVWKHAQKGMPEVALKRQLMPALLFFGVKLQNRRAIYKTGAPLRARRNLPGLKATSS